MRIIATTVLVLAVFMVSGGIGYLFAALGVKVRDKDALAFVNTPIALVLMVMGTFGLVLLDTLPKHLNPITGKAWLKVAVAFGSVALATIYLELLLRMSYLK